MIGHPGVGKVGGEASTAKSLSSEWRLDHNYFPQEGIFPLGIHNSLKFQDRKGSLLPLCGRRSRTGTVVRLAFCRVGLAPTG